MTLLTYSILGVVVLLVLSQTIKILKEYERGVVFLLGRFQTVKGPGLIILIPGIQKMTRVDLRVMVLDVPTQDVISRDNVSVKVNAVIYFRVVNPEHAIIRVANFFEANDIQMLLDQRTDNWGIKVANVEIKHVDLDESMIRAIAQQAEAERARRAKVINAEGEKQAAKTLAEAANMLAQEELALQLRYLQTLKEISSEKTNTIVFPLPLDLMDPLLKLAKKAGENR
jgi:regulator of protease activity HflC (stomatin/prohibitin superfamily)